MDAQLENNKLVAEFMGWKIPSWNKANEYETPHSQRKWITTGISDGWESVKDFTPDEMRFHTSWDWLMPVIQKLQSVTEEPEELDNLKDVLWWGTIKDVHSEVVDLIKQRQNANA